MTYDLVSTMLQSADPSVRFLTRRDVLEECPSLAMTALQEEVRNSQKIKSMLTECNPNGKIPRSAHSEWRGSFWTLLQLVDLGYPSEDIDLIPLREQVLDWLIDPIHIKRIPLIAGLYRRCAAQEAGAVFSLLKLGLADERVDRLVDSLLK